ncbi:MAG TPA: periplasmic heavy metal sensor [Terriglobales bacterium]|nr:periplasmic heavy metal sensor [Terriglobales bacterium]
MKTLSYCLSLLLLTIGIAAAQSDNTPPPDKGPHGRGMRMPGMVGMPGLGHDWWRNSEIAQAINLSDTQKEKLNQIFGNHRPNLIKAKGNVEIEEGKLSDLLEQDKPDQNAVLQQLQALQTARNAMENEFTLMSLHFRNELTPDQWKKLQSVTRERMGKMFRMHHGDGPGAPPPPQ